MLKLTHVNSFYGQLHVLWDVDIEVAEGKITGLIGPNGAGKSTLLKTIHGLVQQRSGVIEFEGRRIDGLPTREIVQEGITYVPEGRRIFPEMTVKENLDLGAMTPKARSQKLKNLQDVFELFPIVKERQHQLAGTLSGGEQQLLAIARGLMGAPKLMAIDEPSLGLSPLAMSVVFRTISEINSRGITILIVEQNVPRLLSISSYAYILENGRVVNSGGSAELRQNEYVMKSYLGM